MATGHETSSSVAQRGRIAGGALLSADDARRLVHVVDELVARLWQERRQSKDEERRREVGCKAGGQEVPERRQLAG